MASADSPDIEYLKRPDIGKVLAAGLAETYRVGPKFPVDFFANWLLNYAKEQKMKKDIEQKTQQQKKLEGKFAEHKDHLERVKVSEQKHSENITKVKEYFQEVIKNVGLPKSTAN